MRRNVQPPLDLVPVMGLAALLIPLLLVGQGFPLAAIDVNLPAMCACHGSDHGEPALIPSLHIHSDGVKLLADQEETEFKLNQLDALTDALGDLKTEHTVSGEIILVADSNVAYEQLIDAMDASRPHFPTVTVAGGVM